MKYSIVLVLPTPGDDVRISGIQMRRHLQGMDGQHPEAPVLEKEK